MTMELENVKRLALIRTLGLAVVLSGLFLATMAFVAVAVLFLRR